MKSKPPRKKLKPRLTDQHGLEYTLPKVRAFNNVLEKLHQARPSKLKWYEQLGDKIWEFVCYYILSEILQGQPQEIKKSVKYLIRSEYQSMICNHVRIEDTGVSITQLLKDKGVIKVADYFECYLAMLYQQPQSPETYMTTLRPLVEIGLRQISRDQAISDLDVSSSGSAATPSTSASISAVLPSPSPTPPVLLSKGRRPGQKRLVPLSDQTAQAFIKFAYTKFLFEKLVDRDVDSRVLNQFLHHYAGEMYNTAYPTITADPGVSKHPNPKNERNKYVLDLLEKGSPFNLTAEIQQWNDVQRCLTLAYTIIDNVINLLEKNVEFKCGGGLKHWTVTVNINHSLKTKTFSSSHSLFEWLRSDKVEDFTTGQVGLRVVERDAKPKESNERRVISRNRPNKRKESEEENNSRNRATGTQEKHKRRRVERRQVR
jgi:hypothetical protein